jgi:hypothetical protein
MRKDLVDEYVWMLSPACSLAQWVDSEGRPGQLLESFDEEENEFVDRWLSDFIDQLRSSVTDG